ncbi:unnamed protein product [Prorocentrum cordatum]|uniref:Uncharacterized protein n=1 Tax=Prorocentrum cordatum TaxID=2364126 RepID=A0ABN9W468_9DINO|nr:unnamed protein product [Polarella glacialis]
MDMGGTARWVDNDGLMDTDAVHKQAMENAKPAAINDAVNHDGHQQHHEVIWQLQEMTDSKQVDWIDMLHKISDKLNEGNENASMASAAVDSGAREQEIRRPKQQIEELKQANEDLRAHCRASLSGSASKQVGPAVETRLIVSRPAAEPPKGRAGRPHCGAKPASPRSVSTASTSSTSNASEHHAAQLHALPRQPAPGTPAHASLTVGRLQEAKALSDRLALSPGPSQAPPEWQASRSTARLTLEVEISEGGDGLEGDWRLSGVHVGSAGDDLGTPGGEEAVGPERAGRQEAPPEETPSSPPAGPAAEPAEQGGLEDLAPPPSPSAASELAESPAAKAPRTPRCGARPSEVLRSALTRRESQEIEAQELDFVWNGGDRPLSEKSGPLTVYDLAVSSFQQLH